VPARRTGVAGPAAKVRTLNLVEWQGRQDAVDRDLDESARLTGDIRFGPHPLRPRGLARPQHDGGLGGAKPLLDDIAVGPVRWQFVVAPHAVAGRAKRLRDHLRLRLG